MSTQVSLFWSEVKWSESCSVVSDSLQFINCIVHGILQVRILEWAAFPFSRGSSQPRDETQSPTLWADPLLAEPQEKPKNTEVSSLSLLRGSSQPKNRTGISCLSGRFFTNWAIREALALKRFFILSAVCTWQGWPGFQVTSKLGSQQGWRKHLHTEVSVFYYCCFLNTQVLQHDNTLTATALTPRWLKIVSECGFHLDFEGFVFG